MCLCNYSLVNCQWFNWIHDSAVWQKCKALLLLHYIFCRFYYFSCKTLCGSPPIQWDVQTVGWGPETALHSLISSSSLFCTFFLPSLLLLLLLQPAMWSPSKQPLWSWVLTWEWWRCKWWRKERRPPGTVGPPPPLQTSIHCRWPQPRPGPGTAGLCTTPPPGCAGSLVGGCRHPSPGLQHHRQLLQAAQPHRSGSCGHGHLTLPRSR